MLQPWKSQSRIHLALSLHSLMQINCITSAARGDLEVWCLFSQLPSSVLWLAVPPRLL